METTTRSNGGGASSAFPYIGVLEGYRGLAVTAIVLAHVTLAAQWTPGDEFLAAMRHSLFFIPEFFFVVSGFVLFLPVAMNGRLVNGRAYAVRRAARILPAYIVSLVVTLVVALQLGGDTAGMGYVKAFLLHLVFLNHPFGVSGFGINEIYWAISILVPFYIIVPLVANWYVRHPLQGLLIGIGIAVGWRLTMLGEISYQEFITFPLFVADFAIGMTGAIVFAKLYSTERGKPRIGPAFTVAAVALAVVTLVGLMYTVGMQRIRGEIWFYGESPLLALAVPFSFGAAITAMILAPRWAQAPLSNPAVRWCGRISYGLLLYHVLILQILIATTSLGGSKTSTEVLLISAIVLPLGLIAGWLSFRFVEDPIRKRVRAAGYRLGTPGTATDPPQPDPAQSSPVGPAVSDAPSAPAQVQPSAAAARSGG